MKFKLFIQNDAIKSRADSKSGFAFLGKRIQAHHVIRLVSRPQVYRLMKGPEGILFVISFPVRAAKGLFLLAERLCSGTQAFWLFCSLEAEGVASS